MELKQFALEVQKMRNAQKNYFRTRTYAALNESKRLESQIDKTVQEILENPENKEPSLFDIV